MFASILRIYFSVLIAVTPPIVAALLQPTLASKVHAAVIAATAVILIISDRFFSNIEARYADIHKSKALTLNEARRLQAQTYLIRKQLNTASTINVLCRIIQGVIAAVLAYTGTDTVAFFYLVLAGYLTLGISIDLLIFFWISANRAARFRLWFDIEELEELKRQEMLEDLESKQLVRS